MEARNRELILHKFIENPTFSASSIAKILNFPKSTVCGVIKRYKETLTIERAPQKNRRKGFADKNLRNKIIRSIKTNPGLSDNDRAKRYGCSRSTVRRIRLEGGFNAYRAIKHPNRTDKQNSSAKTRSRKLYDGVLTKFKGCIIQDDETYVKLAFNQLPGVKYYYSRFRGGVNQKFKYKKLDKFAPKLMIWQALCTCGLKSSVFVTSGTMTSDIYIEECLKKRILPLIQAHSSETLFWPDLATIHYAKKVLKWCSENNVKILPKEQNPPNCPIFRPIEKYWAIIKNKLRKKGGEVKDAKSMAVKWNKAAAELQRKDVQKLMSNVKRHVRNFFRGVED